MSESENKHKKEENVIKTTRIKPKKTCHKAFLHYDTMNMNKNTRITLLFSTT